MPEPQSLHVVIDQLEAEAINAEHTGESVGAVARKAVSRLRELARAPIPMRLPCPGMVPDGSGGLKVCGQLHIDKGEFATKLHHTHSCQFCGMTWRPAVPYTVGVAFLPGFKDP